MPFAWAFKPIYKKLVASESYSINEKLPAKEANRTAYDIDESDLILYEQTSDALSDEELHNYLLEFRKEKSLSNLKHLNGSIKINLRDIRHSTILSKISRNSFATISSKKIF